MTSAPEKSIIWLPGVVTGTGQNVNILDKPEREDDYFMRMTDEEKLAARTCYRLQPRSEAELRAPDRRIKFRAS